MTTNIAGSGMLESRDDFENDPSGQYKYWLTELDASDRQLRSFTRQGNNIVKRYLSEPTSGDTDRGVGGGDAGFHMNLFYSNTSTLESALYGNVPSVDVSRRYADSSDDVGRVAGEILGRVINNDIADNGEEYDTVLRSGLLDRLTVGLGASRVRYTAEFETIEVEAVLDPESGAELVAAYEEEKLVHEDAITEYVHWRDVRWGWARSFSEVKWLGFRSYLTKDEVTERFSEEVAEKLEYKKQQVIASDEDTGSSDETSDAWQKAEIWEIWDKVKRQVIWVCKGYDKVLDTKDDPLRLNGFFPAPPFFAANITSTLYVPTADYHMAQDLYNEIDKLQTRVSIITDAVKVVGLYDSASGDIARMMKEGTDNDMIPVDNWALFAEKGGIAGQVDWFPIGDVVAALQQLIQIRDQTIGLLQQVTGMSDLMRGELANQYEGVGQTQMKAQFGSVRIQSLQEQFAGYATDLMQLKAEVIAKHFSPETIAKNANAEYLLDPELVEPAIELIKDYDRAKLSVKISPESLSMIDYAQLQNERTEYISTLTQFMQAAAPMIENDPKVKPFLLQLLQWGLAGFKGAGEIEGVIDKAIEATMAENEEPEQGTPPEVQIEQMRQQFEQQFEQMKADNEQAKIQAKAEADIAARRADMEADIATQAQAQQAAIKQIQQEMVSEMAIIQAKMTADIQKEIAQAEANIMQSQAAANAETGKEVVKTQLTVGADAAKTELKIKEIEAGATAKLSEKKGPSDDS